MAKKSRRVARARRALLSLSLVLVVAFAAVGGTIAWLTSTTDTVTNVFAPAGVLIDLTETLNPDGTETTNENDIATWNVQMIPGKEYAKNPIVSVVRSTVVDGVVTEQGTDVDVYLFVKFEEKANPAEYMTYESTLTNANGWYLVPNQTNVWYRRVAAKDTLIEWHLLKDDKVVIKDLTKDTMASTNAELVYTAYAIQAEGSDPEFADASNPTRDELNTGASAAWTKLGVQ